MDKSAKGHPNASELAVAARVRELREKKGYSMEKLGQLVGVSKTTVQNWELGKGLRGDNLLRLARVLEVHPREFMTSEQIHGVAAVPQALYPSLQEFLDEFSDAQEISPDERNWLMSQRFDDGVDEVVTKSWWNAQLMFYRGLKTRLPKPGLRAVSPAEREQPPRKR